MQSFPQFPQKCHSLLCKYLTPEVFEKLKDVKTANEFTLAQAINSGVHSSHHSLTPSFKTTTVSARTIHTKVTWM
jgi:hypothetical protein